MPIGKSTPTLALLIPASAFSFSAMRRQRDNRKKLTKKNEKQSSKKDEEGGNERNPLAAIATFRLHLHHYGPSHNAQQVVD